MRHVNRYFMLRIIEKNSLDTELRPEGGAVGLCTLGTEIHQYGQEHWEGRLDFLIIIVTIIR